MAHVLRAVYCRRIVFSIRERVAKILPEPFTTPFMRALPVLLIFVAMFYWLWRVRVGACCRWLEGGALLRRCCSRAEYPVEALSFGQTVMRSSMQTTEVLRARAPVTADNRTPRERLWASSESVS